jgi:hypothetical protein
MDTTQTNQEPVGNGLGWIKLHRSILDSKLWSCSEATIKIAFYLLLSANHEPAFVRRVRIGRGQTVRSLSMISEACFLSRKAVRYALKVLEEDGFIQIDEPFGAQQGHRISICKYEPYQLREKDMGTVGAHQGTQQGTQQGNTNKNDKNNKNENNICVGGSAGTPPALENSQNRESGILKLEIEEKEVGDPIPLPPSPPPPPAQQVAAGETPSKSKAFRPPSLEEVLAYTEGRVKLGRPRIDAERFLAYYQSNGWMVGRSKMRDWTAAVRTWEGNELKRAEPAKSTYVKPQPKVWTAEAAEAAKKEIMEHNRRVAASNPVKGELVW